VLSHHKVDGGGFGAPASWHGDQQPVWVAYGPAADRIDGRVDTTARAAGRLSELRPRYAGTSVAPPSEWPLYVNILDDAGTLIGVGAVYATADDAEAAAKVGLTW
jgi:hypothetical protein